MSYSSLSNSNGTYHFVYRDGKNTKEVDCSVEDAPIWSAMCKLPLVPTDMVIYAKTPANFSVETRGALEPTLIALEEGMSDPLFKDAKAADFLVKDITEDRTKTTSLLSMLPLTAAERAQPVKLVTKVSQVAAASTGEAAPAQEKAPRTAEENAKLKTQFEEILTKANMPVTKASIAGTFTVASEDEASKKIVYSLCATMGLKPDGMSKDDFEKAKKDINSIMFASSERRVLDLTAVLATLKEMPIVPITSDQKKFVDDLSSVKIEEIKDFIAKVKVNAGLDAQGRCFNWLSNQTMPALDLQKLVSMIITRAIRSGNKSKGEDKKFTDMLLSSGILEKYDRNRSNMPTYTDFLSLSIPLTMKIATEINYDHGDPCMAALIEPKYRWFGSHKTDDPDAEGLAFNIWASFKYKLKTPKGVIYQEGKSPNKKKGMMIIAVLNPFGEQKWTGFSTLEDMMKAFEIKDNDLSDLRKKIKI